MGAAKSWFYVGLAFTMAGCLGGGEAADGHVSFVTFLSVPEEAAPGSTVPVCWHVDGAGTAPHVALHTDTTSRADAYVFTEYLGGSFYPDNASSPGPHELPGAFCTGLTVPDAVGNLYVRGHAFGGDGPPGVMNVDERVIRVATGAVAK